MKRIHVLMLALGTIAGVTLLVVSVPDGEPPSIEAGVPPHLGDVDDDALLSLSDVTAVTDALTGREPAEFPERADVNLDGAVDIVDAVLIFQAASSFIPALPPSPMGTLPRPDSASIEVVSVDIRPNEWRDVEIWARGVDAPGAGGWVFDIDFEPGLGEVSECFGFGHDSCNTDIEGEIRLATVNQNVTAAQGDVQLARFRFTCGPAEGSTAFNLMLRGFYDFTLGSPQPIETTVLNGAVTCSESAQPTPTRTPFFIEATPVFIPKVSLERVDAEVGQEFTVGLEADLRTRGIEGFEIDVEYPHRLLTLLQCTTPGGFRCNADETPGIVHLSGTSPEPITGDLTLGSITFRASDYHCETFLRGDADLDFEPNFLYGSRFSGGRIRITGGPPGAFGDVNCDGLDAIDAALVLQAASSLIGFGDLPYRPNVDVSGDGKRDAVDAALILQKVADLL